MLLIYCNDCFFVFSPPSFLLPFDVANYPHLHLTYLCTPVQHLTCNTCQRWTDSIFDGPCDIGLPLMFNIPGVLDLSSILHRNHGHTWLIPLCWWWWICMTDWEKITRLSSKTFAAAKKFIGTMGDSGEPHTQEPEPSSKKGKRGRRNLYKEEVSAPFACAPFVVSIPTKLIS